MKRVFAAGSLAMLAACSSTPLEQDTSHIRLARITDVHIFTDAERKEAAKSEPRRDTGVGMGIGFGVGTFGGFGGVMLGTGSSGRSRDLPPQISEGANRFTVQPVRSAERVEVISYGKYQAGDCVKFFSGHPTEYARLFDLKPGEHCE